jgi:hypothetical protein
VCRERSGSRFTPALQPFCMLLGCFDIAVSAVVSQLVSLITNVTQELGRAHPHGPMSLMCGLWRSAKSGARCGDLKLVVPVSWEPLSLGYSARQSVQPQLNLSSLSPHQHLPWSSVSRPRNEFPARASNAVGVRSSATRRALASHAFAATPPTNADDRLHVSGVS